MERKLLPCLDQSNASRLLPVFKTRGYYSNRNIANVDKDRRQGGGVGCSRLRGYVNTHSKIAPMGSAQLRQPWID